MRKLRSFLTALLCLVLCSAMLLGYGAFALPASAAEVVGDVEEEVTAIEEGDASPSESTGARYEVTQTYQNPTKMSNIEKSSDMVTLDLKEHYIVDAPSSLSKLRIKMLSDRIASIVGTEPTWSGRYSSTKRKIVVSVEDNLAKAALSNNPTKDFIICVYGQNIVITGKNNACALLALDYFLENYLPKDSGQTITLPRVTTGTLNGTMIELGKRATRTLTLNGSVYTYANDGVGVDWQIVFDKGLDHDFTNVTNDPPNGYGNNDADTGNDDLYNEVLALQTWLNTVTNSTACTLVDDESITKNEKLILVGNANHASVTKALAMIDETECIVAMIDGNLVATGHTMEAQLVAAESLKYLLFQYVGNNSVVINGTKAVRYDNINKDTLLDKDDDNSWPGVVKTANTELLEDGETKETIGYTWTYAQSMAVPSNLCLITKVNKNWAGEAGGVVLPDGLELTNVIDVSNNDLEYLFAEEDEIQESHYTAYCTKLETAGFVEIASSTIAGSHFKTYANYKTGVLLQVDYNAFANTSVALGPNTPNASNKADTNYFEEKVFAYAWPTIRVTASNLLTTDMPKAELLNPVQTYTKVCDSKIVSMDLGEGEYGTGYVMQLEDGRFVLVDGGAGEAANITNLWNILTELHTAATGSAPSESNPVKIAAWIVTHCHGDHSGMLKRFSQSTYVTSNQVTLQYFIYNSASRSEASGVGEHSGYYAAISCSFPNYELVKPVTGQTLYIANLKIETLFTHKDIYPQHTVAINDTSTIQRLTFVANASSGDVTLDHATTNKSFSFVSTGDLYIQGSRWMCAMYGRDLKADMVSMSHHGGEGAESAFYDLVQPTIVWWSYPISNAQNGQLTGGGTPSNWNTAVNNYTVKTLDSVKYILFADTCNLSVTLNTDTNLTNLGNKPTAVASTAPSSYYQDYSSIGSFVITGTVTKWRSDGSTNPAIYRKEKG